MRRTIAGLLLVAAAVGAASVERARAADSQPQSCRESAGRKYAKELVAQCLAVSGATHPPCHIDNPCDLILGEIRGSCIILNDNKEYADADSAVISDPSTAFCGNYLDISGEVSPSFDCAKAQTAIERSICRDNELAELDSVIAARYQAAVKAEATTQADQRRWLARRDAMCGASADSACLRKAMTARVEELDQLEQGLAGAGRGLKYRDLAGQWQVVAVRVYGDGVQALVDDDAQYMGAILDFRTDSIAWTTSASKELPFVDCAGTPTLASTAALTEISYDIPGGYSVRCDGKDWGPGAVVKSVNPETLRLYWFDNAILTLKPRPNGGRK